MWKAEAMTEKSRTMMEMVDRYFDSLESDGTMLEYFASRPHENCPTYLAFILNEAKRRIDRK